MTYIIQSPSSISTSTSAIGTSTSTNTTYTITGSNGFSSVDIQPQTIHVRGSALFDEDVEIKGNITVDGIDIAESLKRIEDRLNLLQPNLELEAEWQELRELGDRYRQLERDMTEKMELVKLLKKKY